MKQQESPEFLEIECAADGTHFVVNGKRIAARPGQKLMVRRDGGHAYVEESKVALSLADAALEVKGKLHAKISDFVDEVFRRQPKFDDGVSSKLIIEMGVEGYDDNDVPWMRVMVGSTHDEQL